MTNLKVAELRQNRKNRKTLALEIAKQGTDEGVVELTRMIDRSNHFYKNIFGNEARRHYGRRDQDIALEVIGETKSRIARDYFRRILKWTDEVVSSHEYGEGESYFESTYYHNIHEVNFPNATKGLRKRLRFKYESYSNNNPAFKDTRNRKLYGIIFGASKKLEASVQ